MEGKEAYIVVLAARMPYNVEYHIQVLRTKIILPLSGLDAPSKFSNFARRKSRRGSYFQADTKRSISMLDIMLLRY